MGAPPFEFPNPPFPNASFGAGSGQVTANVNPQRIINGLTLSQLIKVYSQSANTKDICIGDKNVTPSTGFFLQPGKDVTLSTGLSANRWWCVSQDGSNQVVSWISVVDDAGGF